MKSALGAWIIVILLWGSTALLTGCGGGSGPDVVVEGGQDAVLSLSNASRAGGGVIQTARLVIPVSALGEVKPLSIAKEQKPPLIYILEAAMSITPKSTAYSSPAGDRVTAYTRNCKSGGTMVIEPVPLKLRSDITFNACASGTETLTGNMNVTYEGSLENPIRFTVYAETLTFTDSAVNASVVMKNLTMLFTDFAFSGEEITKGTVVLTGNITGSVGGDSVTVVCDHYTLAFTNNQAVVSVALSGRVKCSCLDGWITVATQSPLLYQKNARCPAGGDVAVSAGGNTVRVVLGTDGAVTISYNNTTVQVYGICTEVNNLCKG